MKIEASEKVRDAKRITIKDEERERKRTRE